MAFIGLLLFFQFFNHFLDYYSVDYSSSSDVEYQHILGSSLLDFPAKVLNIPSTQLIRHQTVRRLRARSRWNSNLLVTNWTRTSDEHGLDSYKSLCTIILHDSHSVTQDGRTSFGTTVKVYGMSSEDRFVSLIEITENHNVERDMDWKVIYEEVLEHSKLYFAKMGIRHPHNRDCVFAVTESRHLQENEQILKTVEVRKLCPQKERNAIFNVSDISNEITAISDTILDENCIIASFSDDSYEFRIYCSNGTTISKGPQRFKVQNDLPSATIDFEDVLALHELPVTKDNVNIFSVREHSTIDDVKNSMYNAIYDQNSGPSLATRLSSIPIEELSSGSWKRVTPTNNINGVLSNIYSRNAHRLYDTYYRGKEISAQSENGKFIVFPAHGGALHIFRQDKHVSAEKVTYFSYVGGGFGLYDMKTLKERYYAEQFTVAVFESLKKRLEGYNHPGALAVNDNGSYVVVAHKHIGFVFKQEERIWSLKSAINLNRHKRYSEQDIGEIISMRFVSNHKVAVLMNDGSVSTYDLGAIDSTRTRIENSSTEEGTIWNGIIREFYKKPALYFVILLATAGFIYNEYVSRKRNQQLRAQQQQTQQNQQQAQPPTAQTN